MSEIDPSQRAVEVPVIENVETVAKSALLDRVRQLAEANERFITATCLDLGDKLEVFYHFDRNLQMTHLRVLVDKGESLPSLSGLYLCAFLVENEMRELFGLDITGMSIDFHGRMLMTDDSPRMPMLKSAGNGAVQS